MAKQLKNILINRVHDRALREFSEKYLHGRLLDIGCGKKPYSKIVAPYVTEHVGLDHGISPHGTNSVDLVGTAYEIPAPDASFDCVLCTSVLEHLEEPDQALRECYRMLVSGGVAIYSAPFIWHLHEEPRDFFRYSRYGLEHVFRKAGFEVIELRPLTGFWGTFGQMLVYNIYRFNRGPLRVLRVIDVMGLFLQGLAYALDRVDRAEQWASLYMIVARKP